MSNPYRNKLFFMMVLEFFIWGAWLPLIFSYLPSLGFTPLQQSLVLNAFPAAAILGMFFSNQFADRNFAAEKFLSFSHLIGGLALIGLGFTKEFLPFFLLMAVYCLLYVPTLSITNSIAFDNLKDATKEFGFVRMGGTIGWVLAAWPFAFILVDWNKVRAANPQGIVAWVGTALANGLTGDALRDQMDLHRRRSRGTASRRARADTATHAAQEGGRRRRRFAGIPRGLLAPAVSVRHGALASHFPRFLHPKRLLQLDRRLPEQR